MLMMSLTHSAGKTYAWRFRLAADDGTATPEILQLMAAEFGLEARFLTKRQFIPFPGEVRVQGYTNDFDAVCKLEEKIRQLGGKVLKEAVRK